jgi:hypothetical protein
MSDPFNPSVHSGNYTYHLPTQCFMCLQQAATYSPDINRLVFLQRCVFCEVVTKRCILDTLFKVQAAAHTLGKHQEHTFP